MRSAPILLISLYLLCPVSVAAQGMVVNTWSSQSTPINEAMQRWTYTIPSQFDTLTIDAIELDLTTSGFVLEARTPDQNPFIAAPLASFDAQGEALFVFGLDPQPITIEQIPLFGTRFIEGRLLTTGSDDGLAHLWLIPGGGVRLEGPPSIPLFIESSDGIRYPIGAWNQPCIDRGFSVYTGPISGAAFVLATRNHEILRVHPTPDIITETDSFLLREGSLPLSTARAARRAPQLFPRDLMILGRPEVTLPERPVIQVKSVAFAEEAKAILPVGQWLMKNGQLVDAIATRSVHHFIATDRIGARVLLGSVSAMRLSGSGIPANDLVAILRDNGWNAASIVPGERPQLLLGGAIVRPVQGALPEHRLALVFRPGKERLPSLREGNLVRVTNIIVEGSRREFLANQPRALVDGRQGNLPELDHFWAATVTGRETVSIRFRFPTAVPLAAIDVLHAETVGFDPRFNLRGYTLEYRASQASAWQPLGTVDHETPRRRDHHPMPGLPRVSEVRLTINSPSFLPEGDVARIAEVIFWQTE